MGQSPRKQHSSSERNKANKECEAKPTKLQLCYLLQDCFIMESFHVNERIDLETFIFLCFFFYLYALKSVFPG